jgi:hypothetical protein
MNKEGECLPPPYWHWHFLCHLLMRAIHGHSDRHRPTEGDVKPEKERINKQNANIILWDFAFEFG